MGILGTERIICHDVSGEVDWIELLYGRVQLKERILVVLNPSV
jgi:hypothetical protein